MTARVGLACGAKDRSPVCCLAASASLLTAASPHPLQPAQASDHAGSCRVPLGWGSLGEFETQQRQDQSPSWRPELGGETQDTLQVTWTLVIRPPAQALGNKPQRGARNAWGIWSHHTQRAHLPGASILFPYLGCTWHPIEIRAPGFEVQLELCCFQLCHGTSPILSGLIHKMEVEPALTMGTGPLMLLKHTAHLYTMLAAVPESSLGQFPFACCSVDKSCPALAGAGLCSCSGQDQIASQGSVVLLPPGLSLCDTHLGARPLQSWTSNFIPSGPQFPYP